MLVDICTTMGHIWYSADLEIFEYQTDTRGFLTSYGKLQLSDQKGQNIFYGCTLNDNMSC